MERHHRFYQRIVSQLTLVIAICLGNRSQKIYLIANVMTKLFVVTLAMDLLGILKKPESNDVMGYFEEFSNVHNTDRSSTLDPGSSVE